MLILRLAHHIWKNSPSPFSLWPIKSWFGRGISLKASTHWGQIWYNTNEMKMTSKLQNNYSKTLCHQFPRICCPQIPNKSLQLHRFRSQGPWPDRMNWEDLAFAIADCCTHHFSWVTQQWCHQPQKVLVVFKYGFRYSQTRQMLRKERHIVLGKLRLPRLPWWSLVVWTTRIHL